MSDDSPEPARAEDRVFDLWLAHRDGEQPTGSARERTRVPSWAPPVATPHVDPVPEPAPVETVAEPAFADPLGAPAPEPIPVPTTTVAETPVEPAPAHAMPVEDTIDPTPADEAMPVVDVASDVAEPDIEPDIEPAVEPAPTQDLPAVELPILADEPVAEPVAEPVTEPAAKPATGPTDEAPVRMTFAPRTKARTAVAIGTLLAAAAAVIGTFVASREQDTPSIGIAVTLWVLTGIIWAVHSGTSVTRMSVRGGQLQVVQHGVRTTIDLTSTYTPVEVHGRPGRHGWKVVFRRRDMSQFVIDPSMVDPNEFMRVLRYYRPGIDELA
ncbi:hypothetical protein SAMN04487968_105242 [Nocardioides terrae]|uniref:Uncharacterized protein n=1 Tax=Nocardioides terrae TaxID=574651 RepID=A0A1I1IDT2_9ACTN|nr:hypothetical protein [Nocardioides terrae]SFC34131.1 hypothetical protein SAMN04487968_105242 [Nocardioides terrae]